jgi:putative ABC transport system ATP-binding protein
MTSDLKNCGSDTAMLRACQLGKRYADGAVNALVEVDLTIAAGEFVAIMGPSGSGKSTLLNLIGALDRPTSGELYFQGTPYSRLASLDQLRSEKIGYVFQSFHLLPTLTALENVQIPMFESRRPAARRAEKARELLDAVGLGHRLRHLPGQMSVGERQRASIARALANDPVVLLADEPTGNLDSHTGAEIMRLFGQLHQQRKLTLVMVTHSREIADHADRLVLIGDGRVVSDQPRRVEPTPAWQGV